jgi:hypothetical protein
VTHARLACSLPYTWAICLTLTRLLGLAASFLPHRLCTRVLPYSLLYRPLPSTLLCDLCSACLLPTIHPSNMPYSFSKILSLTLLRRDRNVARAWTTKKSRCLYYGIYIGSCLNYITIIGCKRTSNNADLIQPNQYIVSKNRWAKIPLPVPWSPSDFEVPFAKTLIECTGSNWLVSYCAYINSVRDSMMYAGTAHNVCNSASKGGVPAAVDLS